MGRSDYDVGEKWFYKPPQNFVKRSDYLEHAQMNILEFV